LRGFLFLLVFSTLLVGLSGFKPPKNAVVLTGKAYVNDGDGITVDRHRIRLYGVDAPELGQRLLKKE